ncbi:MAG: DUF262 domain-containing protein [Bosea sp. (in: a-proteobacteria)]
MTRHTIEASEKPILDIFCDKYLFRIPSYQRPYAWTTEQTSELLDDVSTACGETGDVVNASPYFLGSIVLIKDPQRPEADVVDGQQRLTTLTIMLSVLRDLSEQSFADDIDEYVCIRGRASAKKYWTRRGIAEWLVERLAEDVPTLVGIDHGFSFPLRYFEVHRLLPDWPRFLDDFQRHWPTDEDHVYVDFVRDGLAGNGAKRMGNARWRRLTEECAGSAKSVFHFDVQGQVAKSTHAGIPWLRFIRQRLGTRVHFWPFDGWAIPAGRSAIAEFTRPFGRAALPSRGAPAISTTLSASPPGFPVPTATAALRR